MKELRHKEFKKNKDKSKKNKTNELTHQEEHKANQTSQKRARSKSQSGNNPWKQPNVGREWSAREGSSSSHDSSWNQGRSNWQQGWASDLHSYTGSHPDPNVSNYFQQNWQSYPAPSNFSWPFASSSSSGASSSRDIQAYRSSDGSRGPASLRSRQQLPDDHF